MCRCICFKTERIDCTNKNDSNKTKLVIHNME